MRVCFHLAIACPQGRRQIQFATTPGRDIHFQIPSLSPFLSHMEGAPAPRCSTLDDVPYHPDRFMTCERKRA
jgi:hypothetical protein